MAALKALYSTTNSGTRKKSNAAALKSLYPSYESHTDSAFGRLNDEDLASLSNILAHQPAPDSMISRSQLDAYQELMKNQIERLPSHLRAQKNKSSQLLCSLHSKLNIEPIESGLRWIRQEIDINIPASLYNLVNSNGIPEEIKAKFRSLREVSGMWVDSEEYQRFFKYAVNPRWAKQEDNCAACILARIGGECDILVALKAGMIASTAREDVSVDKRHKFVDVLISNSSDAGTAFQMTAEAERIGIQIKEATCSLEQTLGTTSQDVEFVFSDIHSSKSRRLERRYDEERQEDNSHSSRRSKQFTNKNISNPYIPRNDLSDMPDDAISYPPTNKPTSKPTSLEDEAHAGGRFSFMSSSDYSRQRSCGSSIIFSPISKISRNETSLESYYAPVGQSSSQRAMSYSKDIDEELFLRDLNVLDSIE